MKSIRERAGEDSDLYIGPTIIDSFDIFTRIKYWINIHDYHKYTLFVPSSKKKNQFTLINKKTKTYFLPPMMND
jgi:hypothetical protein